MLHTLIFGQDVPNSKQRENRDRDLKNPVTSSSEFDFRVNLVIIIVVSSYLVLSAVLLLWIVDSFAFISMPLARGPRGRKRFGAGRRLLSPASFTKSSENRGKPKHKWSQEHSRIYIKKEIHET